jgi:hypothetical protein
MKKIYIVIHSTFDYECSAWDNVKAFADKAAAEFFKLELEETAKVFNAALKEFKAESSKIYEPYWALIRKRSATKEQISEYGRLFQERFQMETDLKDSFKIDGCDFEFWETDEQEFQIEELDFDE